MPFLIDLILGLLLEQGLILQLKIILIKIKVHMLLLAAVLIRMLIINRSVNNQEKDFREAIVLLLNSIKCGSLH